MSISPVKSSCSPSLVPSGGGPRRPPEPLRRNRPPPNTLAPGFPETPPPEERSLLF